jgi:hypothetical protein
VAQPSSTFTRFPVLAQAKGRRKFFIRQTTLRFSKSGAVLNHRSGTAN